MPDADQSGATSVLANHALRKAAWLIRDDAPVRWVACVCEWEVKVDPTGEDTESHVRRIHAAHVVSKLTDAGYSIVPSANRAEAHQWDGTRASIETLCRWANDEGDPMDDATLTYTYSRSDDSDVDFAGPAGYKAVSVGDWIVRMATGEFLLARGELTAAAAEREKP